MEPNKELPPVENTEKIQQPNATNEQLGTNPENSANIGAYAKPTVSQPMPQVSTETIQTPQVTQQNTSQPTDHNQLIADDTDLIEKEWVHKAKEIVEQTKHDPHLQTNEISKFKAHYQKKRYNKDVKVSGGQ